LSPWEGVVNSPKVLHFIKLAPHYLNQNFQVSKSTLKVVFSMLLFLSHRQTSKRYYEEKNGIVFDWFYVVIFTLSSSYKEIKLCTSLCILKLRCDKRSFTACCYVFKGITLVSSNQSKYFENACWKLVSQRIFNNLR